MKKIILIILCFGFIFSCKKCPKVINKTNPLDGKLKSFWFADDSSSICTFFYDSVTLDLDLVKLNDSTLFTLEKLGTDKLKISEHFSNGNNFILNRNGSKQITSMDIVDENNLPFNYLLNFTITNDTLQAIQQNNYDVLPLFSYRNIESHHFNFLNGNCISSSVKFDFGQGSFLPIYIEHNDTMYYEYNSIANTNNIFWQMPVFNLFSQSYYVDMLYIAQLAGFYTIKPNKNLISYRESLFTTSATKIAHTFNYLLDEKNRVKQMTLQQVGEHDTFTFNFSYY